MKRTTLILLLLFLVFGGAAIWYLYQPEDEKTTLAGADRRFAVEDISQVHKIFIADREGTASTLERQGKHWLYNGQHKARPAVMEPLLEAIQRIQVRYKPPQAAVDNMIRALATQSYKVELYDKNNRLIKAYYLGGATADERGAFAIMEGADQPYVVDLPAWEGNVTVRFSRKGDEWRDKLLFEHELEDIQSVSIEYPQQRSESFRLEHGPAGYEVKPFYDITPEIRRPYRLGSAEAFLLNFAKLSAEEFDNSNPRRDSIQQLLPFSIITLVTKSGDTTQVKLHPIVPERYVTQDIETGAFVRAGGGAIERYFAELNEQDFLLVQHLLIGKVLWSYRAFFEDRELLN